MKPGSNFMGMWGECWHHKFATNNSRRIIRSCSILLNSLINIAAKGKFWRRICVAIALSMNGHYIILRSKNNNKIVIEICAHWLTIGVIKTSNDDLKVFKCYFLHFECISDGNTSLEDRYLLCLISKINKLSDWNWLYYLFR